jgi:thiosulfate reductase/polysulfide reductase chain A
MYAHDDKTGRRMFLKTLGAGAAVGAAAGAVSVVEGCAPTFGATQHDLPGNAAGAKQWGRTAGEWIPSCCNMCGGQSGVLVHVVDGVVEKIEPNDWNPNNYSNISSDFLDGYDEKFGCKEGGALCPKGNAAIAQLYDPDRVKKPLKRTNPDRKPGADPSWQEISWDQAISEIAAKMKAIRDSGDAHKLLWMSEDHSFVHVQQDFCKLYGTPNYSNHSNICDVARKASFKTVVGHDRPLADFIQSKHIMLFGWNPTSAIKWVYLPRIITRAIERGAKLVVVDPYLSDTAAKAQEWVSIRPGTDGALALAMAHVIIRDNLHNKEFIDAWTVGFKEYAEYVKDKTPDWAEKITTIRATVIERLARELATTKPALVDAWSGPGQHSNAVQGGRAIAMLNTLIGAWDRPGGMIIPDKQGGKHAAVTNDPAYDVNLKKPRFDELEKYPLGHSSGVYSQTFANLAEGKGPYKPRMMVCMFQNPMMSVPGTPTVAKGLAALETLVVIDTMMSETAELADYVLPGTTYLERYDLNSHWVTWPVLGLRQPVVKPIFGQPAEYETVALLGRALGLKDAKGVEFFSVGAVSKQPVADTKKWYEESLSNELKTGAPGITLDELKALPGAVWVDKKGTRYAKYETPVGPAKLATAFFDGDKAAEGTLVYDKPKADGGKMIGIVTGGRVLAGFATPSGKVEFRTAGLASKKDFKGKALDPLPVYTPRDWQPDSEFPLFLINWKEASHTHSRTQNNPWLLELKPFSPLVIHPDTAARFSIAEGDDIVIESPHGSVKAKAHLTLRMHPEVVGLHHGFGHTALGRNAKGRGTSDGSLRPAVSDPVSGQSLHKEACVRIRRAAFSQA